MLGAYCTNELGTKWAFRFIVSFKIALAGLLCRRALIGAGFNSITDTVDIFSVGNSNRWYCTHHFFLITAVGSQIHQCAILQLCSKCVEDSSASSPLVY